MQTRINHDKVSKFKIKCYIYGSAVRKAVKCKVPRNQQDVLVLLICTTRLCSEAVQIQQREVEM